MKSKFAVFYSSKTDDAFFLLNLKIASLCVPFRGAQVRASLGRDRVSFKASKIRDVLDFTYGHDLVFFFVSLCPSCGPKNTQKKNVKKYTADELLSEYPEYLRDSHVLIVSLLNIPLTHLLIFHLSVVLLRC